MMSGLSQCVALAALFLACAAEGRVAPRKAEPSRPVVLKATAKRQTDIPFFSYFGQARSDDRGNLYFHAATRSYNNSTLIRISPKDSQTKSFLLPNEFAKDTAFESFFVTPSGSVYVLAEAAEKARILFEFNSDGDLMRHTRLQTPADVFIDGFAVFESGSVFLAGYRGKEAPPKERGRPFLGFFDESGDLIKELSNSRIKTTKNFGDTVNTAVQSDLWTCLGEDGNLYLLAPDQILAINESGGIVRRIKLSQLTKGASATMLAISGTQAAIWLNEVTGANSSIRLTLEIMDLNTGKIRATYVPSEETGETPVSFSWVDGFLFLKFEDNRISLVTAAAQ